MSFDTYVHDRLVVVRLRSPDVATSLAITRLVERHHDQLAQLLVFVLIIGTDCPMPDPEARRQLAAAHACLHPRCAETRVVVLGRELRQALVRSLVTGFSMLPGRARPNIDGSIFELLTALERSLDLDRCQLRSRLIEAGLFTAREASWHPVSQLVT